MIGVAGAVAAAVLGATGFRTIAAHQRPTSALGAGVSDAGVLASGLVSRAVGSATQTAGKFAERSLLVTGASVSVGTGVAIDAVLAPFANRPSVAAGAAEHLAA
jgi:hypothetical protein